MITTTHTPVVLFVTGNAGDWGGANRVQGRSAHQASGLAAVSLIGQACDATGAQDLIAAARLIDDPQLGFRIRYLVYIKRAEDIYPTSDIIVVPSRKRLDESRRNQVASHFSHRPLQNSMIALPIK